MPMQTTMLPFSLRMAGGTTMALLIDACVSPEPVLHTLSVRPEVTDTSRFQRALRLSGVRVPDRLDKPQIVLCMSDSEVVAFEQQHQAASFGSGLHGALSANLTTTLSAVDVGSVVAPAGMPPYRIGAEIRSYGIRPGRGATALVTWRASRNTAVQSASTATLTCQTMFALPASGSSAAADPEAGVNAVVSLVQRFAQQWSQQITQNVQGLEAPSAVPA